MTLASEVLCMHRLRDSIPPLGRKRLVSLAFMLLLMPILAGCDLSLLLPFLPSSPPASSGQGYPNRVLSPMAYSPDGKFLAVGYYGNREGELEVWDTRSPVKPLVVLPAHGEELETLAFSGDSKRLAYASSRGDGVVRVVDTTNLEGSPVELRGHALDVRSIAMTSDGQTLVSVDLDNVLRVWNLADSRPSKPSKTVNRNGLTNMLAISPDGQLMAIAGYLSTEIELVKVSDPGGPATILRGVLNPGTPPVFSPDGRYLAIGASTANLPGTPVASVTSSMLSSAVQLWDLSAPDTAPWLLTGNAAMSIGGVAFSPDGKWLANTKVDVGLVEVWDISNVTTQTRLGTIATEWNSPPAKVFQHDAAYSVAFSPDDKTLVSGSMYTSIKSWEYLEPSPVPTVLVDPPRSQP
jgi:WD40 repeat protein